MAMQHSGGGSGMHGQTAFSLVGVGNGGELERGKVRVLLTLDSRENCSTKNMLM